MEKYSTLYQRIMLNPADATGGQIEAVLKKLEEEGLHIASYDKEAFRCRLAVFCNLTNGLAKGDEYNYLCGEKNKRPKVCYDTSCFYLRSALNKLKSQSQDTSRIS